MGADGIVVLADGVAELVDFAVEQVDCAAVGADLTIVIEDFNKHRKRRGMRVWRGKKYVRHILKYLRHILNYVPCIFSFLREGCWSGFSRFNIPPAEVDVSLCSAPLFGSA